MVSMGRSKKKRAPAAERRRSRSGAAGAGAAADVGRWNSQRKMEAVLRLLRGEAQHGLRHLANLTTASDNGNVHASKYLVDRQRQRQAIRAGQAGPLPPRQQELHDELRALVEDPVFRQVLALKSRLPGEEWPVFAEALREFIAHRG
jgi:hypothetical protein